MTDCAECRALLALLADVEDRARREVRQLSRRERAACVQAARRLAELCVEGEDDAETSMTAPAAGTRHAERRA